MYYALVDSNFLAHFSHPVIILFKLCPICRMRLQMIDLGPRSSFEFWENVVMQSFRSIHSEAHKSFMLRKNATQSVNMTLMEIMQQHCWWPRWQCSTDSTSGEVDFWPVVSGKCWGVVLVDTVGRQLNLFLVNTRSFESLVSLSIANFLGECLVCTCR